MEGSDQQPRADWLPDQAAGFCTLPAACCRVGYRRTRGFGARSVGTEITKSADGRESRRLRLPWGPPLIRPLSGEAGRDLALFSAVARELEDRPRLLQREDEDPGPGSGPDDTRGRRADALSRPRSHSLASTFPVAPFPLLSWTGPRWDHAPVAASFFRLGLKAEG